MISFETTTELLTELEADPRRVQLHTEQLEETISSCMDRICELAKQGETTEKMQLVAIEHRARLLLEKESGRSECS